MRGRRKSLLICGSALVVLLFVCSLWMRTNPTPRVQLPKGLSIKAVLAQGDKPVPKGWYTIRSPGWSLAQSLSGPVIRYKLDNLLGRCREGVPNPPIDVDLRSNLAACSGHSGEIYLLAREFLPARYSDTLLWDEFSLGYRYGGTNRVRSIRDWVAINEAGIVENGVVAWRRKDNVPMVEGAELMEPYRTNQCAVIRDTRGVVKIVPLNCLRAYRDSGLIRLSAAE